jgi:hypothetical protein
MTPIIERAVLLVSLALCRWLLAGEPFSDATRSNCVEGIDSILASIGFDAVPQPAAPPGPDVEQHKPQVVSPCSPCSPPPPTRDLV